METNDKNSAKDEMLLTFASGVAHNFNNILTAGMGFLSLAMDMTTDKETLAMLRNVELCHQRISHLARQLLSFTGDIETQESRIFLTEALNNALNIFDSIAMKHRAVLVCEFSAVRDVMILADRFQLVQALVQILKNAVESCSGSSGLVKYRARLEDGKAVISIKDNGRGIAPEEIEKLSSPFYTTKQVVGVGLGLSTARAIIERMGGELKITSELAKGTNVEMSFPVVTDFYEDNPAQDVGDIISDMNILLAIDAEQTREALTAVLMSYSFTAYTVDNEQELFKELDEDRPGYDLVILDLLHTETMGDDLIQIIRKYSDIPIVYLYSSDIEKPTITDNVEALSKPFDPVELVETLAKISSCTADGDD